MTSIDLDSPGMAMKIAERVSLEIDAYCKTAYDDGHRKHLGASLIGHECKRYLWYVFRWCKKEQFDGRMMRLFNRGHREEARFIEWLKGIGFQIWFEDENGKQFRISGANGHFGGSLDGIAKFPESWGISDPILLEFKTSGTGTGFNKLGETGMAINKPMHFAQTSCYGARYDFKYVLYGCINKNDDSIHWELTKLDTKLASQLEQKAEQIIFSQTPPPKLSENPTYRSCQYCAMKGVCHGKDFPEKNCRSCIRAEPVENGQWRCMFYQSIIPDNIIVTGCKNWSNINV